MCFCTDGPQQLVTDWARGDVVCAGCGVVLEAHLMDDLEEYAEWGASRPGPTLKRPVLEPREAALAGGLATVDRFVSLFGQSTAGGVACTARQLFGDVHGSKKSVRADACAAAAVYYAFKMEGVGRELRFVAAVCGVDMRALHAAVADFKDTLRDKDYYPRLFARLHAGMLLDVFIDRLRLPRDQRTRLWRAAHRLDEELSASLDSGRKPRTLCSGVLWLAAQVERLDIDKRDLAAACAVCPQTMDKMAASLAQDCCSLGTSTTGGGSTTGVGSTGTGTGGTTGAPVSVSDRGACLRI